MKIFYHEFSLTPLKQINRLSSLKLKKGIFLMGELKGKALWAEYFPHVPLGDASIDEFLSTFKFQDHTHFKKVFHHLLLDGEYQKTISKRFHNHQLYTPQEALLASVVKYKMIDSEDLHLKELLRKKVTVRLDCNGLFNRHDFLSYLEKFSDEELKHIEYVEDPLSDLDWRDLPVKTARDFIAGKPFDYFIYKPNRDFFPDGMNSQVVFSSYLGSDLGTWHCVAEMSRLKKVDGIHGLVTSGYYAEERHLFDGNYHHGFSANSDQVHQIYNSLTQLPWKSLCSI